MADAAEEADEQAALSSACVLLVEVDGQLPTFAPSVAKSDGMDAHCATLRVIDDAEGSFTFAGLRPIIVRLAAAIERERKALERFILSRAYRVLW